MRQAAVERLAWGGGCRCARRAQSQLFGLALPEAAVPLPAQLGHLRIRPEERGDRGECERRFHRPRLARPAPGALGAAETDIHFAVDKSPFRGRAQPQD